MATLASQVRSVTFRTRVDRYIFNPTRVKAKAKEKIEIILSSIIFSKKNGIACFPGEYGVQPVIRSADVFHGLY
jgi:hypothetical protein